MRGIIEREREGGGALIRILNYDPMNARVRIMYRRGGCH